MTDEQKLAVKKFLYGVKSAVMVMDVDSASDEVLATVFNGFVEMMDSMYESSSSSSEESSSI